MPVYATTFNAVFNDSKVHCNIKFNTPYISENVFNKILHITISGNNFNGDIKFPDLDPSLLANNYVIEPYFSSYSLANFNGNVTLTNAVKNCDYLFRDLPKFNQPVTIPNSVTNCYGMFQNCAKYNQPVNIPNSVTDCASMFYSCANFNSPVIFESGMSNLLDCRSMFNACSNFNQVVVIPNSVTNCSSMFAYCNNLNSTIIMGRDTINCINMFSGCYNFNKPLVMSNSVKFCDGMFYYCGNLNSPITLGSNITNAQSMFYQCQSLCQDMNLPDTLNNTVYMFMYTNMNYVGVPNSVINCEGMYRESHRYIVTNLVNTRDWNDNIYIPDSAVNYLGILGYGRYYGEISVPNIHPDNRHQYSTVSNFASYIGISDSYRSNNLSDLYTWGARIYDRETGESDSIVARQYANKKYETIWKSTAISAGIDYIERV